MEEKKAQQSRGPQSGSKHKGWAGDGAHQRSIHDWIRRWKAEQDGGLPSRCEYCGREAEDLDCACLIKEAGPDNPKAYTRKMIDYAWLCRTCHNKMDKGDEEIRNRLMRRNKNKYTGDEWTGK